ncbi:hypothetical protein [Streptomyces sp. SP17KL33]|uniref:hypothetical protein n=1 Tax=Streptomyces sp. SP17KL33 TaxID=3002534 RepID=UPI002E79D39E|nr:hypothetical protein [Streptomyces sp. SP17KL33]MEE1838162.1 hypothetical protein [Streptomyces sp. SP17KL33]
MPDFVVSPPAVRPADALTYKRLVDALAALPTPPAVPRYPDKERRERYADIIRNRIKTLTLPAPYPGAAPMAGATEYDIADVVLAAQDAETDPNGELAQLRAERDRLQRAVDDVRRFNETTAEASCRVQAVEHARDTLNILDRALDPAAPPQDGKKPCGCCSIDEVCSGCGSCSSICYGCG